MNEVNVWNPFSGFEFPDWVADILWVETQKGKPSDYTLSIGIIGLQEFFSCVLCTGRWEIPPYFGSGSIHVKNFRNVWQQQSPL